VVKVGRRKRASCFALPSAFAPYTLHSTSYILHPTPYTLQTLHYTLHPTLYTPTPKPRTRHHTLKTSRVGAGKEPRERVQLVGSCGISRSYRRYGTGLGLGVEVRGLDGQGLGFGARV
jgi:hypothetical protein